MLEPAADGSHLPAEVRRAVEFALDRKAREVLARVGSNALVFMAALYMLRGAAVFVFVSGGMSLFGYVTVLVGLIVAAPVLMGMAVLIGVGDTWLDLRSRVRERTA